MKYDIKLLENSNSAFPVLKINKIKFKSEWDSVFDLPQKLVKNIHSDCFPVGVEIRPFKYEVLNVHHFQVMPIIIVNLGNGLVRVDIEACKAKGDWNFPIEVERFQTLKSEVILTREEVNPEITILEIDDSAAHLHYSIDLPSDTIKRILKSSIMFDLEVSVKILESSRMIENDLRENLGLA